MQTLSAAQRLRQLVKPTTFVTSELLDELTGCRILLATETFQHTGSFKFRAAFNAAQMATQSKLITASSGNFGQALAYSCQLLKKQCIVVMPQNAAKVKIDAVRGYGGIVELVDVSVKTRAQRVNELGAEHADAGILSAFDDVNVIAGNATLGEELADAKTQFDCILVPVGGGGLLAGIIQGLKNGGCDKPVYGVEPALANDAARSVRDGVLSRNDTEPQTIADGVRTLCLGEQNWPIIRDNVAGIIEASEESIVAATKALFYKANLKVEPTGALSLAGVMMDATRFAKQKVCCIVSGGNVDLAVLLDILNR